LTTLRFKNISAIRQIKMEVWVMIYEQQLH
jgi:hypothetical protein